MSKENNQLGELPGGGMEPPPIVLNGITGLPTTNRLLLLRIQSMVPSMHSATTVTGTTIATIFPVPSPELVQSGWNATGLGVRSPGVLCARRNTDPVLRYSTERYTLLKNALPNTAVSNSATWLKMFTSVMFGMTAMAPVLSMPRSGWASSSVGIVTVKSSSRVNCREPLKPTEEG